MLAGRRGPRQQVMDVFSIRLEHAFEAPQNRALGLLNETDNHNQKRVDDGQTQRKHRRQDCNCRSSLHGRVQAHDGQEESQRKRSGISQVDLRGFPIVAQESQA